MALLSSGSALASMDVREPDCIVALGQGERAPYERDETISAVFEQQVRRAPHAVAAASSDGRLTYAELESRANRLANHLCALGVAPGDSVGVALDRSLDVPVALLGILKAGGAYVPLDPSYPLARLEFMVVDADVTCIVTSDHLRDTLPACGRIVALDADAADIAARPAAAPALGRGATDCAYIMYTSGSTGRPKGVAVPHRGVVRLVRGTNFVRIADGDVVLHYAPLGFDASTFEIWAALLNSATVAIPRAGLLAIEELDRAIERFGVTTMWLTTSLFQRVVDDERVTLRGLRRLLTGGDVVSPRHATKFIERFPGCGLINGYGPTENTTFSTTCDIVATGALGERIPIGKPIANSSAYVLDAHLGVVPVGVEGELCVGGDGVALGYLNLPELSAARFVPDPFAATQGARMYRTGDRARYRPDGLIEFLGRTDGQVKVRGFRIELAEVEAVLKQHAGVRDAAVVVAEQDGHKTLFAYVVPGQTCAPDEGALRAYAGGALPAYMVPNRIATLAQLPELANGKIDRLALVRMSEQTLDQRMPGANTEQTEASVERAVLSVWRDALGDGRTPGLDENFFDAGADSLRLLTFHALLVKRVRSDLSVMALFENTTVRKLSAFIGGLPAP